MNFYKKNISPEVYKLKFIKNYMVNKVDLGIGYKIDNLRFDFKLGHSFVHKVRAAAFCCPL